MESLVKSPPALAEIAGVLAPQSLIDTAAITAVVLVSAAFFLREYTWDKPDPYHHLWYEKPQENSGFGPVKQGVTRNIAQRLEELVSSQPQPPGTVYG